MRRANAIAVALSVVIAGTAAAGRATKHKHAAVIAAAPNATRGALEAQLAAEGATVGQAMTTVRDKLAQLDSARVRRLAAVARQLDQPLATDASGDERMASARRRAALRLLVQRDADEHALLADELALLDRANTRVVAETGQIAEVAVPGHLAWPADGHVVRPYGTFVHEATAATLSRRGVDLDVEDHADVTAPADGVIRYAGPIRGLEHGVVIEHRELYTVIGKLGDALAPAGTPVKRGDHIGRAAHHRVYFEVRVKLETGGLPIDPGAVVE